MSDKKNPDPFPQLPRRPMFEGMGVQPEDDPSFNPLVEGGGFRQGRGSDRLELKPVPEGAQKILKEASDRMRESPAQASALAAVGLAAMDRAPKRTGRPPTVGKPWEAEGISRALWYRREKAKKNEA